MREQRREESAALDSTDTLYDGWGELQDVYIARGIIDLICSPIISRATVPVVNYIVRFVTITSLGIVRYKSEKMKF